MSMRHIILGIMNLGIFLFLSIGPFYLRSIISFFLSLSFPSSRDQHFVLPVITAVQNSTKTVTKKLENMGEKQNVLCVLTYLLSTRDCAEEKFIVAFVKYNPWLFVHTLLESQKQTKKESTPSFKHPSE